MKKHIVTLACMLALVFTGLAQNPFSHFGYSVRAKYKRPIRKEILEKAQILNDIIPDYPASWISDYVSVEILVNGHGKTWRGMGSNTLLTPEQKNVLYKASLADDIEINVEYKTKNTVTGSLQKSGMHTVFTVVPEVEAQFVGGDEALRNYLKQKGIEKMGKKIPTGFSVSVGFTVNEQGTVEAARITHASGNAKADTLLLHAIETMPAWKPAQNARGIPVKQEFELQAGDMSGGGC